MLLSIIIPIFNREKTIKDCLNSILEQNSYIDFEIILVNDGSTDNTLHYCSEYTEKYKNIKIISQNNQGVSVARNTGLQYAIGKYIWFIDSDDEIPLNSFKIINRILQQYDSFDILNFNIEVGHIKFHIDPMYEITSEFKDSGKQSFIRNNIYLSLCNKIYKKHFIEKNCLQFEKGYLCEDLFFNIQAFHQANLVIFIPDILYRYKLSSTSTIHNPSNRINIVDSYIYYIKLLSNSSFDDIYLIKGLYLLIRNVNSILREIDSLSRRKKLSLISKTNIKIGIYAYFTNLFSTENITCMLFQISPHLCYFTQTTRSKLLKYIRDFK